MTIWGNLSKLPFNKTRQDIERFKERWDFFPQVVDLAYDAFNEGRILTEEEYKPFFQKGLIKSGYLKGIYRVYKNYLFIFERSQKYYVLITLYPFK